MNLNRAIRQSMINGSQTSLFTASMARPVVTAGNINTCQAPSQNRVFEMQMRAPNAMANYGTISTEVTMSNKVPHATMMANRLNNTSLMTPARMPGMQTGSRVGSKITMSGSQIMTPASSGSALVGYGAARRPAFTAARANLFPYKRELRSQAIQMSAMSVPCEPCAAASGGSIVPRAPSGPAKIGKYCQLES